MIRRRRCFTLLLILGLGSLCALSRAAPPQAIVAADGSTPFKTVQEAINAAPQTTSADTPWIIEVRPGTYREVVYVQREKRHVRLIGGGADAAATVITAGLFAKMTGPDGQPIGTFRTPTMQIDADDFTVENLTLENSAGDVGQALAVRVDGDRVAFRRCRFLGYQDTILVNRGRQYFEDCVIVGAVDFIFGGATAWFRRCEIVCVGSSYITAASTPPDHPHGFVFERCRIRGERPETRTYLGRPWRDFAATVFLHCEMSEVVRPAGWHNWDKPHREQTTRYAEFGSTGPGADAARRVPWARQLTEAQAAPLTVQSVLGGLDGWRP